MVLLGVVPFPSHVISKMTYEIPCDKQDVKGCYSKLVHLSQHRPEQNCWWVAEHAAEGSVI